MNLKEKELVQETIFQMQLSEHAKIAYLALKFKKKDNEVVSVSYEKIAEACSYSRKTAMRAIKELVDAGIIEKIYCKSRNEPEANAYVLKK